MFEIKSAKREAMPILLGLWSVSGGGKTLSALRIARGLVGPEGKIGLIDTENRRALFYADEVGGWDHLDFQPPFTPDRYVEAYNAFQKKGQYDCIIIDSVSHGWDGQGGVIEMAENNTNKGIGKWKAPKTSHKRMANHFLRSPTHMIFCIRAKESIEQKGSGQDMEITKTGLVPICEKNFIYEMTVSVLIGPDHKPLFKPLGRFFCSPIIPAVKIPGDISDAIKAGEFLSEATGAAIAKWVKGGAEFDAELAKLQQIAREVATMGTAALQKHWESQTPADQKKLMSIKADLKQTSAQADIDAKAEESQGEQPEANTETNTETTSSLDDGPTTAEKPAEEPKEPEKEAEAPAATKTEKPAETATKEPEATEPEKEPAQAVDEKPAEKPDAGNDDVPKFIVKSSMGDEYKFITIEEWSAKALAMVKKAGTDKKALEGFNKRHASILTEMEAAYPEQVQAVREAVNTGLKPSVNNTQNGET